MTPAVTVFTTQPLTASARFTVSLRDMPDLADHGFHDLIVLPGSLYIEMARGVWRELSASGSPIVRSVSFHNPVILSEADTVVLVSVKEIGGGRTEYTFFENDATTYAARLEIHGGEARAVAAKTPDIAALQQSTETIEAERFYARLRANRNQYGPSFQQVRSIWRRGDESLGALQVVAGSRGDSPVELHPSVLDSAVQMLVPFIVDTGRTFILRSMGAVDIAEGELPSSLWAHAVVAHRSNDELIGSVRLFDTAGQLRVELSDVALSLLEQADSGSCVEPAHLALAANFTAEPVEEALQFWANHFGTPLTIEFAPYNQVFQQLLGTNSALQRNREGINAILLSLEEWLVAPPAAALARNDGMGRALDGHLRYVLPNGLEIAHLNPYETDYVYSEIFEDQCYLRHGVRLDDGGTVVDIGANIGLFSLFVAGRCPNTKVYAFEPAPVVHAVLRANCQAYAPNVHAVNMGVSARPGTAAFTFYEKSSVFSGFHADEADDRQAIEAVVRNTVSAATSVDRQTVQEYVNELTAQRLGGTVQQLPITSVSEIIREHGIERIDLLKIDAEKSELEIIQGIGDADWPKISQIVIEIHDRTQAAVTEVERLLAARGFHCAVERERLLEDSGLFNLYAVRHMVDETLPTPASAASGLERTGQEFAAALRSFAGRAPAPLILCLTPRSPEADADPERRALLDAAEHRVIADARTMANVHAIDSTTALRHYPVADYHDPHTHHAGHVPYTPEAYAAIGTALIRTIHNLKRTPIKVIVLDCDNTLWKGVCGEDGPLGVEIGAPFLALQEFMLRQMHEGALLCLCSKNNEDDVFAVFDQRADMLLKREHVVAHRINWLSKAHNLTALAAELDLGLDSFALIDDSPLECADVRASCPDVLTLQLPEQEAAIPAFLQQVWAFDRAALTTEDSNRTQMYQEQALRQRFLTETPSLKDFIEGLRLRVDIREATANQLPRVAQLTVRTNQFNFTTVRRSEPELRQFLQGTSTGCLSVQVADRFGDYGVVGAVLYKVADDRFNVDTFLLSCRVLGRGVEHAVLAHLAHRAMDAGKPLVALTCTPTARNAPAQDFVAGIAHHGAKEAEHTWLFPAERLLRLEYHPDEAEPLLADSATPSVPGTGETPHAWDRFTARGRSLVMQGIAGRLTRTPQLVEAIDAFRTGRRPQPDAADSPPATTLEQALLGIWRKVLGRPQISVDQNFFEAGGTSLKAVQVIALIRKELKENLSIVTLFEYPTVSLLASRLGPAAESDATAAASGAAVERGHRRRQIKRRRVS